MTDPQTPETKPSVFVAEKMRDLLNHQFTEDHFIIGSGLMSSNSLMFVAGPPKSYKSWVLKTILIQLAAGLPIFNANRVGTHNDLIHVFPVDRPRKVLYLEMEIGRQDLQTRYNLMLPGLSERDREVVQDNFYSFSTNHDLNLDSIEGAERIGEVIASCQPDIVAFDPLAEFHNLDENKAQEMMSAMRYIDLLREKLSFATIICHHQGKSGLYEGRSGPDLLRGSSVMYGKGDSFVMLKYDKRDEAIKTEFTIRRGKPIPAMNLRLNPETMLAEFHSWIGGKKREE